MQTLLGWGRAVEILMLTILHSSTAPRQKRDQISVYQTVINNVVAVYFNLISHSNVKST